MGRTLPPIPRHRNARAARTKKREKDGTTTARRGFTGAVPEKAAAAVSRIKDRIYGFKFGGGTISSDDMKSLVDEIAVLRAADDFLQRFVPSLAQGVVGEAEGERPLGA